MKDEYARGSSGGFYKIHCKSLFQFQWCGRKLIGMAKIKSEMFPGGATPAYTITLGSKGFI